VELVARSKDRWAPPAGLGPAAVAVSLYFGILLVPKFWPGFAANVFFFVYILSLPFVLFGLVAFALRGALGPLSIRLDGPSRTPEQKLMIGVALWGCLVFGCAIFLSRSIRGALPTRSYLAEFDSEVWKDPESAPNVRVEITPRQKMLGSLVDRLKPSQNRAEIEALLGPSQGTPYFQSTGRDLIYRTGPERDTFLSLDSEWLLIWLDETGKFERYAIDTD